MRSLRKAAPVAAASGRRAMASHPSIATACVKRRAVHPGCLQGVSVPIVPSTTYRLPDADTAARVAMNHSPTSNADGFFYSRWKNPTAEVAAQVGRPVLVHEVRVSACVRAHADTSSST